MSQIRVHERREHSSTLTYQAHHPAREGRGGRRAGREGRIALEKVQNQGGHGIGDIRRGGHQEPPAEKPARRRGSGGRKERQDEVGNGRVRHEPKLRRRLEVEGVGPDLVARGGAAAVFRRWGGHDHEVLVREGRTGAALFTVAVTRDGLVQSQKGPHHGPLGPLGVGESGLDARRETRRKGPHADPAGAVAASRPPDNEFGSGRRRRGLPPR